MLRADSTAQHIERLLRAGSSPVVILARGDTTWEVGAGWSRPGGAYQVLHARAFLWGARATQGTPRAITRALQSQNNRWRVTASSPSLSGTTNSITSSTGRARLLCLQGSGAKREARKGSVTRGCSFRERGDGSQGAQDPGSCAQGSEERNHTNRPRELDNGR